MCINWTQVVPVLQKFGNCAALEVKAEMLWLRDSGEVILNIDQVNWNKAINCEKARLNLICVSIESILPCAINLR